jgi:hypothetical protein
MHGINTILDQFRDTAARVEDKRARSSKQLCEEAVDLYHKLDKHINPISFPELEYILLENNIRIEKIATNKYIRGTSFPSYFPPSRFIAMRIAMIIAMIISPFIKAEMIKHFGKKSLMSSNELLFGEILILKAKKL